MTRQEHLLTMAAEEAAELAQCCAQALRFGLEAIEPGRPWTNRDRILGACADLLAAIKLIGITTIPRDRIDQKRDKIERFLLDVAARGTRTP